MQQPSQATIRLATLRIVAIYAFFGAAWILVSDNVLGWLVSDPVTLTKVAVFKGWLYVLLTSLLLYKLINRDNLKLSTQQNQLEELNCTLEERVSQAIAELREKDELLLQQSRQAAMGEMLNNIAHQWRQPLNNIGIYVQNMQLLRAAGELTDAELQSDVQSVMEIVQQMSRTIDDFRTYFHTEKTRQPFALKETVEQALRFVSARMEHHGIDCRLEVIQDITVTGFQSEYTQVLLNILNNAIDALDNRSSTGRWIKVTLGGDSDRSVLSISDNGGGISAEALPHIFEPYFTTKDPISGTGIGLYMAKVIIEKHMSGSLVARNTAEGAEFIIELP